MISFQITLSCIWVPIPVDWVILRWYACGADGRSLARSLARCTVTWLPNFSGMGRLPLSLAMGLRPRARFALRYDVIYCSRRCQILASLLWFDVKIKFTGYWIRYLCSFVYVNFVLICVSVSFYRITGKPHWRRWFSSHHVKSKSLLRVCPSFAMWHQNSRCSIDWLSLMIDCVDNKWAVSLKEINERCTVITAHSKGALTIGKPGNSRENSNGTVYPGGNLPEKK